MAEHFNRLTPAEHERLAYLMEECGEVIQAIGKIMRHGWESRDPTKATPTFDDNRGGQTGWRNTSPTNREALARELGDVRRAIDMLTYVNDVPIALIDEQVRKGVPSKYMHHQDAA